MYRRSPERRRRQKLTRPPTFRVENEQNPEETPQYFQITVNLLEARKLAWCNPHSTNSYVVIVLGKKKFRSNIRLNMRDPYYNERYVYEIYASIRDLQQSSLWLGVMQSRCCAPSRLLGETSIDLGAIWAQPHHQVFHKWAQLMLPRDTSAGPVGFLKVDIAIIVRGEMQVMPAIVSQEPVDNNLLLPTGSEQQRANYLITIYGAFGLPSGTQCHGDRKYGKPPSTFIRATFCDIVAKTAVHQRNSHPMYSEQISIVEMFPNTCQTIQFEVCSADNYFNRVLARAHLKLSLVSHDGENGFLPTFGPSLVHMYGTASSNTFAAGEDGPFHRGTLFISLKTLVPYYQQSIRSTSIEPVTPIKPDQLWVMEDFCIWCPLLEVSMLDSRIAGKVSGVAITTAEINLDDTIDEDFSYIMAEIRSRKLHYTGSINVSKSKPVYGFLDFQNDCPVLQISIRLPDFRFRMFRNNMINAIVAKLESSISDMERRIKALDYSAPNILIHELNDAIDDVTGNVLKFLDIVAHSEDDNATCRNSTELDVKQLSLQKIEMEKLYQHLQKKQRAASTMNLIQDVTKKGVKLILAELKAMTQNLSNIICKISNGWPDVIIWLLNGGSRVAYARISTAEIIHSEIQEQRGINCGRIQTVFLKPIKCPQHTNNSITACHCIAGKIELILWMGLYKEISCFEQCLPEGMRLQTRGSEMTLKSNLMMLECRIFIHKAKLNQTMDSNKNYCFTFLRANVLNSLKETKVIPKTAYPVWNQILKIQRMVYTSLQRITDRPPVVLVELYESDLMEKQLLLGSFQIQPVVDDRLGYEYAPKLVWHDIYKGFENIGQVLIAAQLLQLKVPEELIKTTNYCFRDENNFCYSTNEKDYIYCEEEVETLPTTLIPDSKTFKVDVYWWGLRDVSITRKPCVVLEIDDLTIKSDIITDKNVNCNFPNGRSSYNFEGPLNEGYSSLNVRLCDSGTFGRTLSLGANVVKNPIKYIVNWTTQNERVALLKTASITSSEFSKVNQIFFLKRSSQSIDRSDKFISNLPARDNRKKVKAKISLWKKIFWGNKPTEEEHVLLPMFVKEKDQTSVVSKTSTIFFHEDWWERYFHSLKDCNNEEITSGASKITIYDSELEKRPEFSKLKDWCSSLKLYNGKKTGIPEKDEQLLCGILKIGIAIYSWPPAGNIVAVSPSGVDLNNGYFQDLPNNEPTQFLVRVYLVKGIELKKKDFNGKSNPYVLLNCGKKILGDRNSFVKNNVNPIFGRMFEFHCNLPEDYMLTISLYDYDSTQLDELIGTTVIDLEDRVYTKHRARTGIAAQYNITGPPKWRDCIKPSEILEELCSKNNLPPPLYPDFATVIVNGVEYKDSEKDNVYMSTSERKENICLSILHKWHTFPICGFHLVPEHVETRSLLNPEKPGFELGKIQMWVDIFPLDTEAYIPPPVDITPRVAKNYELRLIIWNVLQLKLDEMAEHGKCPNIYVRAWIGAISQSQDTDIHYRCTNGEGNFNWRMVFNFQYQLMEEKIIIKEKGPFIEYEQRVPPILIIQVMDTDAVLADDSLGTLSLNLNSLPRGVKHSHQCTLESMEEAGNINLLTVKTVRAWWPLSTVDLHSQKVLAGVIDMELILLPKEQALLMPVGVGRSSPSALPEPQRQCVLNFDEMCRHRLFRILVVIGVLLFLSTSAVYLDVFPSFDATPWINVDSGRKSSVLRNLYPVE